MSRYIEENEIYNLFNARGVAQLHVGDIDVLPRAEVKEVVHGLWKVYPDERYRTCPNCKMIYEWAKMPPCMNYCPNCGAKMEE